MLGCGAPGEQEGLPHVLGIAAHHPILGAKAGNIEASVSSHPICQRVVVLQVERTVLHLSKDCDILQSSVFTQLRRMSKRC